MANSKLVPMYGARFHYIGEDGIIYDSRTNDEYLNPWLKRVTLNTVLETPYEIDGNPTQFSYGERLVWSFYGKSAIPFELSRDTDVITINDIRFVPTLDNFSQSVITVNGEEFRLFGTSNGTRGAYPFLFYVNQHGCPVTVTFRGRDMILDVVRWKYVNGYAFPTCRDFQNHSIHSIVNSLYGRPLKDGEILHHEDECHWNNSASNVQPITRSEHIRHHSQHRGISRIRQNGIPAGRFTTPVVEKICQMLQDDIPISDIALAVNPDPAIQGVIVRQIGEILAGRRYSEISKDYNFSGYHRNRGPIRESDAYAVEKACQMLSDSKPHSELEIAGETGLSVKIVNRLRLGQVSYNPTMERIWKKYKIDPKPYSISAFPKVLSNSQVYLIRRYCEGSNLDDGQIGSVIGCSAEVVRKIRNGTSKPYGHLFDNQPADCPFSMFARKYKKRIVFTDPELEMLHNEANS